MAGYYPPASNLPHTFRCTNHPDREGVGICVNCRSVVCVECSTKIDRMNYCIRCLQAAAPPAPEKTESRTAAIAVGLPVLLLSFGGVVVVFAVLGYLLDLVRQ
jgi:hypothetical protein